MIGNHGLQNPRGFGLPGLTWFAVLVNDKPLLYAGLPAQAVTVNFDFCSSFVYKMYK